MSLVKMSIGQDTMTHSGNKDSTTRVTDNDKEDQDFNLLKYQVRHLLDRYLVL